jgi:hypothetical protein
MHVVHITMSKLSLHLPRKSGSYPKALRHSIMLHIAISVGHIFFVNKMVIGGAGAELAVSSMSSNEVKYKHGSLKATRTGGHFVDFYLY